MISSLPEAMRKEINDKLWELLSIKDTTARETNLQKYLSDHIGDDNFTKHIIPAIRHFTARYEENFVKQMTDEQIIRNNKDIKQKFEQRIDYIDEI